MKCKQKILPIALSCVITLNIIFLSISSVKAIDPQLQDKKTKQLLTALTMYIVTSMGVSIGAITTDDSFNISDTAYRLSSSISEKGQAFLEALKGLDISGHIETLGQSVVDEINNDVAIVKADGLELIMLVKYGLESIFLYASSIFQQKHEPLFEGSSSELFDYGYFNGNYSELSTNDTVKVPTPIATGAGPYVSVPKAYGEIFLDPYQLTISTEEGQYNYGWWNFKITHDYVFNNGVKIHAHVLHKNTPNQFYYPELTTPVVTVYDPEGNVVYNDGVDSLDSFYVVCEELNLSMRKLDPKLPMSRKFLNWAAADCVEGTYTKGDVLIPVELPKIIPFQDVNVETDGTNLISTQELYDKIQQNTEKTPVNINPIKETIDYSPDYYPDEIADYRQTEPSNPTEPTPEPGTGINYMDILRDILDAIRNIPRFIQELPQKLIDLLKDLLKELFIPTEQFLEDQFNQIKDDMIVKYDNDLNVLESLNVDAEEFTDVKMNWHGQEVTVLSAQPIRDNIAWIRMATSCFFVFLLLIYVYNQIYFLIRGTYPIVTSSHVTMNGKEV